MNNDPTLIFLHGWRGSKQSLSALSNEFKPDSKILVLEMPGHGDTPEMSSAWGMREFSLWLQSKINENNIEKYILIGHSFGGKIILESVISSVLTPQGIVLIDSNGIKPRNSIKKSFFKTLSNISSPIKDSELLKPIKNFIYKTIIRENDYAKTSGNIRESFKKFNEENYDELLKNISVPTIIIWGKDDKVTPLWMAEKLKKEIKNSKLYILEGTHGLPLKNPNAVAKIIKENL